MLQRAGIWGARRNVEWMLSEVTGLGRAALYARLDDRVSLDSRERFRTMLARRSRQEPLQHILGYTDFYGLRIDVAPDVLIPRPETEQVVERALKSLQKIRGPRILDVGTGSGCIALAIKHNRPDADVTACDISASAIEVAALNAERHALDIRFQELNVLRPEFDDEAPHNLDLLISNPPYIATDQLEFLAPEVRCYEPRLALEASDDPLKFYRRLADAGTKLLRSGGHIVLETAADYGEEAAELLERKEYGDVELNRDYAGRPRILTGIWPRNRFSAAKRV